MAGTPVPFLDLAREHRALDAEIREAIDSVLRGSAFVGGEVVRLFEEEFAAYCGARHCVGVANGTDALVLALRALGVGPGDAVLTVPFTFLASVEAIDLAGAEPLLVDIDERDFTIDVAAAERVLREREVKAVIAVHLYGQPADMVRLVEVARRHGAAVVEDAAQAHGARLSCDGRWRRAGSLGDIGCFSFYPTKNLGALGDAGAVTTDSAPLAERLRLLHDHGQAAKYRHVLRGATNSRLDGLQAAVLRLKLRHLDAWNEARRAAARRYESLLAGLPLRLPWVRPGAESVHHQYVVRLQGRDLVQERLGVAGIQTAIHYPVPVHLQEAYRSLGHRRGAFPASEKCAAEVLSLPLSPTLAEAQQVRVARALAEALGAPPASDAPRQPT
jgi:dTDP-4-amino-4,6-dideoxygalactose transaminase